MDFIILFVLVSVLTYGHTLNTTVVSKAGTIVGFVDTVGNVSIGKFLGIPFAESTGGEYRFKKPRAVNSLDGVFDAMSYGPACPMEFNPIFDRFFPNATFDEDCLSLNVFVPIPDGSSPETFGVIVWIHAYISGSAKDYDPFYIVTKGNVIVVTMNYRVGALGFLSTSDENAPGNYGLWDQHLVIKWVKENIAAFGGDDSNIAIFGESAGGASVGHQVLSPHNKGLFKRAMLASGSALSSWAISKGSDTWAWDLGNRVGCNFPVANNEDNNKALIDCLRSTSTDTIIESDFTFNYSTLLIWKPDIDGDFIPDDPVTMLKDEEYLAKIGFVDIDLFVGANNNEGSISELFLSGTDEDLRLREPDYVKYNYFLPTLDSMYKTHNAIALDTLSYEYTLQTDEDQTTVDEQELADAFGDLDLILPTIQFGISHIREGSTTCITSIIFQPIRRTQKASTMAST